MRPVHYAALAALLLAASTVHAQPRPTTSGGASLSDSSPAAVGSASAGVATDASRSDHVHAHGNQAGGALHSVATGATAGFESAADKTKLDAITGTNTGDVTLGAVGSTPANEGASLSGQVLTLQPADATHAGVVSTTTQTIAGAKTFSGAATFSSTMGVTGLVTATGGIEPATDAGASSGSGSKYWAASFAWNAYAGTVWSKGANVLTFKGQSANGSTAQSVEVDSQNSFTTAGATLFDVKNAGTLKASIDKDGSYRFVGAPTLQTCASGLEGKVSRDGASGGTSGSRTRICVCTSDGGGTPAYAWQNMVSGTVGNSTTCNN